MDRCTERDKKRCRQLGLNPPESERTSWITHETKDRLSLFLAGKAERLGTGVYDFVRKHWLGIINLHILSFILGSLCAPFLAGWGEEGIARYIYGFYGLSCHQIPSRSFYIFDHQIAICARCFSFYISLLIFGVLISLVNFRPLKTRFAFLLAVPVMLDVLLQTLGIRESTNLIRVTTALLLSLSLSFYIYPRIKISMEHLIKNTNEIF